MKKKIRRKLTRMWSDPNMPAPLIWEEAAKNGVSKEECDALYADARAKFRARLERQLRFDNAEARDGGTPFSPQPISAFSDEQPTKKDQLQ